MIPKTTPSNEVEKLAGCDTCKKCDPFNEGICCQTGSGLCEDADIKRIADFLDIPEDKLKSEFLQEMIIYNKSIFKPKTSKTPFGPCVFFKKGKGCSIHPVKPLQCRISNWGEKSQEFTDWFLEYCVNPHDSHSIDEWKLALDSKNSLGIDSPEERIIGKKR